MLTFTIPGPPVGKGRPRIGKVGNHSRMFTPEKTVNYETLVAVTAQAAMKGAPLFEGPVCARLDIACQVPASWSKKRRADALSGRERPTKTPDIDNIAKAAADGMNGVVWVDDVQIVELICIKRYAETPGVTVTITSAANS